MRVVLQEEVYCRKTVLQYSLMGPELYCKGLVRRLGHNTKFCIATVGWARRWARQQARALGRAGRAGRRRGAELGVSGALGWRAWGARQGARQAWLSVGRARCSSALGAQATGGRRAGRHGVGAQGRAGHGRPGRGLGAGWVCRLGQLGQFWCTVHLAQF